MFSKSTIKYIQSLQHKKFRDEHNYFIAEGPKLVTELLVGNLFESSSIYAVEEWMSALSLGIRENFGNKINIIKDFELEKISALKEPNQVLAVFNKKIPVLHISTKNKLTLVLDDIQDPGNLGTIIRIADWFGIENIICSPNTADCYNSKVVQSTMASLGRVNIMYTNLVGWLSDQATVKKYAATLAGRPLAEIGNLREGIIIIGNEAKGISQDILQLADEEITIPKTGAAESLNAAVAAGIILYVLCV